VLTGVIGLMLLCEGGAWAKLYAFHPHPEANLPHIVLKGERAVRAGKSIPLAFELRKGWHLNLKAPLWLGVYDSNDKPVFRTSVAGFQEGSMSFSPLAPGKLYRLQGTVYSCPDKDASTCLIESIDLRLKPVAEPTPASAEITITLPLQVSKL
jgi:hypothetical protein